MIGRIRKIAMWIMRALGILGVITAVVVAFRSPSLARDWDPDVRVLASVQALENGKVALQNIRDWRYTRTDVVDSEYFDATFDPDDIVNLWMYEQKLSKSGLIAHTFLVFEFDERYGPARYLGISVETRREVGENFSIVGGVLRSFEITHIWASERDLVRRRVEFLDYPLTRFRLLVPAEIRAQVFRKLTEETMGLADSPEWYNTALNNCTSSLIRYVNDSVPGAIPSHHSYVFTGRTAGYLGRLGHLDIESAVLIDRAFLASNELR